MRSLALSFGRKQFPNDLIDLAFLLDESLQIANDPVVDFDRFYFFTRAKALGIAFEDRRRPISKVDIDAPLGDVNFLDRRVEAVRKIQCAAVDVDSVFFGLHGKFFLLCVKDVCLTACFGHKIADGKQKVNVYSAGSLLLDACFCKLD
jgi:hypothetical protein